MPNTLTLPAPFAIPTLQALKIKLATNVNDDAGVIDVVVSVFNGDFEASPTYTVTVRNGQSDSLLVNPTPKSTNHLLIPGPQVDTPTGFNDTMAAYAMQGKDGIFTTLIAAGVLPAGTIS